MNRTLVALWTIIAGSIVTIAALAAVWSHERETSARLEFAGLLRRQLDPYNRDIARVFEEYDRTLQDALEDFDPGSRSAIAALERKPIVGLVVVAGDDGAKGERLYPTLEKTPLADRSLASDAFDWIRDSNFTQRSRASSSYGNALPVDNRSQVQSAPLPASNRNTRSAQTQTSNQSLNSNAVATASPLESRSQKPTAVQSSVTQIAQADQQSMANGFSPRRSQWTTWYHGRGIVLGYWSKSLRDTVTMVVVPRGRWLADIVAALPDNRDAREDALVQLLDVEGSVVTQWGNLDLAGESEKDVEVAVLEPLDGWRLCLTLTPQARAIASGTQARWASALGATGFSLAFVSLGLLITFNLKRQLRLAQQQVSFVNQVSHELRTPLTNIRMYTDLTLRGLEAQQDAGLEEEVARLSVIQHESSRLCRLIDNVLCFARLGRGQSELRLQDMRDVDAMIDETVSTFRPQLEELKVEVQRVRGVTRSVRIDREIFEQILVNLVSNALKYAACGRLLRVESALSDAMLTLRVIDAGPGIPKRMRRSVFEPFVRVSNRLEDPAGTGIGLSIARRLARQHGGDCILEATTTGCSFVAHLRVG